MEQLSPSRQVSKAMKQGKVEERDDERREIGWGVQMYAKYLSLIFCAWVSIEDHSGPG